MKTLAKTNILIFLLSFGSYAQSSFFWQNISNVDSLHLYSDSILAMPANSANRISKNIQVSALRKGDSILYATALSIEAKARFIAGELNQAAALQNEALAIFRKYDDTNGQCASLIALALIDYERENQYHALSKLRKSAELSLEVNEIYYQVLSQYHIARIHFAQQEYATCRKLLLDAKSTLDSTNIDDNLGYAIIQQMALVEIEFRDLPKAYNLLSKTKPINLQPDYIYNLNLTWSKYWQTMQNTNKAEEFGKKALQWASKNQSPALIVEALLNLSAVSILKNEQPESIEFALRAKQLQQTTLSSTNSLKLKTLNQLYKTYIENTDTAKALITILQFKSLQDSLKSFELNTLPLANSVAVKPNSRKLSTPDTLQASSPPPGKRVFIEAKSKKVIIGLIIVTVIAVAIGLFFGGLYFKRNRELKKLKAGKKELAEKEKQTIEEQKKLKESNQKLQELDKNKNKVFSILTHDIRQPINQIKSVLELLQTDDLTREDRMEIVQKLRESIDNSSNALENLLLWSKKQLTGINTKIVDVHLLPQVWQIESQVKANLESKNLKLDIHIPDFLKVKADMSQLDICLRNLVNNAIKFSNRGGVITIEALEDNGDKIIKVIDNGVGMSIDQVDKLKNMKGDFSTLGTMNEKGTGLGVLITREFMQNQNGELDINSRKGEGSVFSMIFHEGSK